MFVIVYWAISFVAGVKMAAEMVGDFSLVGKSSPEIAIQDRIGEL
jgi:hypothetical protein